MATCAAAACGIWVYPHTIQIAHLQLLICNCLLDSCAYAALCVCVPSLQASSSEFDDDNDAVEASLLADLSNEDDWGLECLINPAVTSISRRQRSLVDQLSQQESANDGFEEGSLAAENSGSVRWGGSAGTTGIDMEEQEELLRRYFRPDQVCVDIFRYHPAPTVGDLSDLYSDSSSKVDLTTHKQLLEIDVFVCTLST